MPFSKHDPLTCNSLSCLPSQLLWWIPGQFLLTKHLGSTITLQALWQQRLFCFTQHRAPSIQHIVWHIFGTQEILLKEWIKRSIQVISYQTASLPNSEALYSLVLFTIVPKSLLGILGSFTQVSPSVHVNGSFPFLSLSLSWHSSGSRFPRIFFPH